MTHVQQEPSPVLLEEDNRALRRRVALLEAALARTEALSRREREDLETSEELFRGLFELAPDPVTLSDAESGMVLEVNEAWCRLTGVPREAILGRDPRTLGLWSNQEDRSAILLEVLAQGGVTSREAELVARDGTVHRMLLSAKVLALRAGRGVLVVGRDVTELDRAMTERQRARKAESLVLMAGGIAHDFNNHFQALLTSIDLMSMLTRDQAACAPVLAGAKETLHRATKLSWKMLDYSGYFAPVWERVALPDLLTAWAAGQKAPLRDRLDLALTGVPPVKVDVPKLRTVLDELLANAWEAMAEAGLASGRIRVHLDVAPAGPRDATWVLAPPGVAEGVSLAFSNDGPLPDREILARMFDPFFSTRALGRGLGLASVVGLVKAHGAGLQVLAEPGRGLTFRLQFRPAVR